MKEAFFPTLIGILACIGLIFITNAIWPDNKDAMPMTDELAGNFYIKAEWPGGKATTSTPTHAGQGLYFANKSNKYTMIEKRESFCSVGESRLYEHPNYRYEGNIKCIAIDAVVRHSSIPWSDKTQAFTVLFQSEPTEQEIVDAVKKKGSAIVESYVKEAEEKAKEKAEIDRLNNLLK